MSRLANLSDSINNALVVLGKPNSLKWQVFSHADGKLTGPEIATILKKASSNVTLTLSELASKGLIETSGKKKGKAIIYKKIPELRGHFKSHARKSNNKSRIKEKQKSQSVSNNFSSTINQIVEIGKKIEIENIDQNWIDSLVILNFIETATTKFLMDHGYTDTQVKNMKWDAKLSTLQAELFKEATVKSYSIRTASISFFRNYRDVRNDQDHIAHLPTSHITKFDLQLLKNNLKVFIKTAFSEHKKYCALI